MIEIDQPPLRAELMERARSLVPLLRASADEIDEARQLPAHIVAAMKRAGVFRMSMPKAWGGWEADPITQNLVIEEISAANGSAGWCLMIGLSGGFLTGLLDQDVGRAMYPDPDMLSANAFVPPGRAVAVEGGYVVNGRWPFASGITHADWVQATASIVDPEQPEAPPARPRFFFAPIAEVEVIDTWQTTGLRGTGSRDFAFNDLFIPAERCVDHIRGPWNRPGPLYQSFVAGLLNHFGVPLGIGRRAVEAFVTAMRDKPAKFGTAPRDEAAVQTPLAHATAMIAAARAYGYETIERIWREFEAGRELSPADRYGWRLANAWVHDTCAEAIELLQHAAGSMAVYLPSNLDRCFRDIHTARQHGIVAGRVYEQAGRAMLTDAMPPGW
jgi:alkylation response protein AidB-like acyl-CoA dehydrogenase